MADRGIPSAACKDQLQVQHRIHILIGKLSLLISAVGQSRVSLFFQKPAVQNIDILRLIHTVKKNTNTIALLLRKLFPCQCLIFIHNIFTHCIHSGQKRVFRKFFIKQRLDFLRASVKALNRYVRKIHKLCFQLHHITIQTVHKLPGLFFLKAAVIPTGQKPFQTVIAVLTVIYRILQPTIGKGIQAHLPDRLLPQFRQNMGNII